MIEIQVNGLVKSFEVGQNVLDGLTFQIDQGERVGLLGKNGAGKTTLFKILTGELECDEGQVTIGQGHRLGLISQIPVYPADYTVENVLRSAFSRLHKLAEEMEALTQEELEWIAWKEQQIAEAGAEYGGGSLQIMAQSQRGAEVTRDRVYELMECLETP